jgi:hypothetical protein
MKYMLLMTGKKADFDDYASWPKEDLQASFAFMRAFGKELNDAGVFVSTEGLAFPDKAKIVRAGTIGQPVTDGVFPESKEFLAGYWMIDVKNAEEAYQIAARLSAGHPALRGRGSMPVEVRRVADDAPERQR